MWCVAELNEDYIRKMEDVLETYEQSYNAQQPVVCLDEKPVTLHADEGPFSSRHSGAGSQTRQRIRTLRHGQRVLRGRAQGGPPFHFSHAGSFGF
jgi:hypothetical protein